jgi:hypothetical protein
MVFVATSVVVFAISLPNDSFYVLTEDPWEWKPSYLIVLYGWMAMHLGVFNWLANPLLFASWWMMLYRPTRDFAVVPAIAALGLSMGFLLYTTFPSSTGGSAARITGHGPGYWLWNTSIWIMVLGSGLITLLTLEARWQSATNSKNRRQRSKGRER